MSAFSDLYVSRVLATPTSARRLDTAARRWRWLRTALFDPYRPELHYMRGPRPEMERKARLRRRAMRTFQLHNSDPACVEDPCGTPS
jgi:hypothetical protein